MSAPIAETQTRRQTFHFRHTPELDGVRGCAILLVLAGHLFGLTNPGRGVDLFFVLSGFLITLLLLRERDKYGKIQLRDFYARRALRLFPALGAVILAVYAGSLLGWMNFPSQILPYILTYTTNFGLVSGNLATDHVLNPLGPTWSLAVEEQFYLIWPLVFVALSNRLPISKVFRVCLYSLVLWETYRWWILATNFSTSRSYYGTDTHGQVLLVGCVLAFLRHQNPNIPLSKRGQWVWTLVVLCVVALTLMVSCSMDVYVMTITLWAIGYAALIWAATLPLGLCNRILSMAWLRYLGTISYGIYLYHIPVHVCCLNLGLKKFPAAVLATALTLLVSTLSFYLVEKPALRYKTRFAR